VLLVDQPAQRDSEDGALLSGSTGYLVKQNLEALDIPKFSCHTTSAILCQPGRKLTPEENKFAVMCCRPRLEKELAEQAGRVIFAMGQKAIYATTGIMNIRPWLGYFLEGNNQVFQVLACPAPGAVFKTPALEPVFRAWLGRAWRAGLGKRSVLAWPREYISGPADFERELRRMIEAKKPVGIDVETAGIDPIKASLLCIGIADKHASLSIPWPCTGELHSLIAKVLAAPDVEKVMHNGQHDVLSLEAAGFEVNGFDFDTLLAHAVVANQLRHDLGFVAANLLDVPPWKAEFRVGTDAKGAEAFTSRPAEELRLYNARDAFVTLSLRDPLLQHLAYTNNGWELFKEYMDLQRIGMRMRETGIRVNPERFAFHREYLAKQTEQYRAGFAKLLGADAENYKLGKNGSHGDLKRLFFDKFDCKPTRFSEETGEPKLDAAELETIIAGDNKEAAILARVVLALRKNFKLLSVYIDGLPKDEQDTVRPTWKVHGAITGRWASSEPNMQNIPKAKYRTENGAQIQETPSLRDLFVPRPGYTMVEADFSQLELRIVAILAKAPKLLEWYAQGLDVHAMTARAFFGDGFTKKQRDLAKSIEYAFNYNLSDDVTAVWKSLVVAHPSVTIWQIKQLRKKWFEEHPELRKWQLQQIAFAKANGYIEERLSGRREYFHNGKIEPNKVLNFPVQGFAGTLMNRAVVSLDKTIVGSNERLLLQVHDAVIGESREVQPFARRISEAMEQVIVLDGVDMRFPIDIKAGNDWGNLKDIPHP
jgi:DNA polymerase-1